jgi:hypothetical protein
MGPTGIRFHTTIEINGCDVDVDVFASVSDYNDGNEHEPPSGPEVEIVSVYTADERKRVVDYQKEELEEMAVIEFNSY